MPDVSILTSLELTIEEVWGWYKEVKSRYGIQKEGVEEMLAAWISFIGNLAEYTSFTNPNDWQKQLDEYREHYESMLLTIQPEVIQTDTDTFSPLRAAIKEVEGWYTDIKENGNLNDKQVYERDEYESIA